MIEPNNDEVICPCCVHQFRAIPYNVQKLLLAAGYEPPFRAAPQAAAPPSAGNALLREARGLISDCAEHFKALRAAGVFVWPNHPMNPEKRAAELLARIDDAPQAAVVPPPTDKK